MASEGRKTPIAPSLIQRVAQGIKYIVSGVEPSSWFGPQQPLLPQAQEQAYGRQFEYDVGYNLRTVPKDNEGVSYWELRQLADNYDLLRILIEARKDQICKIEWTINAVEIDPAKPGKNKGKKIDPRIKEVAAFLKMPDGINTWQTWLRAILEELLVVDAVCVYPLMNRGKKLSALHLFDGTTLKMVIDESGRRPLPPSPAYQQRLHGVPAVDYNADQLIFAPRNVRVNKLYGRSPVENIIMTVNIALRRQMYQLGYYTDGSTPDLMLSSPPDWNTDQIRQFQTYWDSTLKGDTSVRRGTRFVPNGLSVINTKEAALKDVYDEWLARVCCYALSISPTPFISQVNRATAESAQEAALQEGLIPLMQYVKDLMDRIIWKYFGYTDLEFGWKDEEEIDPLVAAQIEDIKVKNGTLSVDEVRLADGNDPIGMDNAVYTGTGPILLRDYVKKQEEAEKEAKAQAEQQAKNPPPQGEQTPGEQPPKPGERGQQKEKQPAEAPEKVAKKARLTEVETSVGTVTVNWDYDVPYLGGGSEHFKKSLTVYLDKDFDPVVTIEGDDVDTTPFLAEHEAVEATREDEGDDYKTAHTDYAVPAENKAVKAAGYSPKAYNDALKPALAAAYKKGRDSKKLNTPPDMIEKPYDHPRSKLQRKLLKEVEDSEKVAKAARRLAPTPVNVAGRNKAAAAISKTLTPFLRKQAKKIAGQISLGKLAKDDVTDQVDSALEDIDFSGWAILQGDVGAALEILAKETAVNTLAHIGIKDSDLTELANERAEAWAAERSAELVGKKWVDGELVDNPRAEWAITDSTRGMLRGTVTQAIEEGWSNDRLAQELESSYAFSPARADMIARTEAAFADSSANMIGYRASGVVTGKIWLLSADHDIDDPCTDNADAGEIGLDDEFPSGDDAPPNHPNCQCSLSPVVGEE